MSLSEKNFSITIDKGAGFCFGVEKAISIAEAKLAQGEEVYGLGEMVHNDHEVRRLEMLGLKTLTVDDFQRIGPAKVILRAHGEPPRTYEEARRYDIEIIDATCPIVQRLQQKIKKTFHEIDPDRSQIVIFGKEDHPETIGLVGQTGGNAIVISDPDDLDHLDKEREVFLFSQTTMDPDAYDRLESNLRAAFRVGGTSRVHSECSICNQMKKRKPDLARFAVGQDVVLFLAGQRSSNGKMLFEFCKNVNSNTFRISGPADIQAQWLKSAKKIGISGATSTSFEQLENIRQRVLEIAGD